MREPSERELAVFSDARKLPARERALYLDAACAGDAAFRQRVEELLQASDEAGDFLAGTAARLTQGGGLIRPTAPPSEQAGDRIGRYKLVQVIGEGGCGVVYLAEQEEPVRREVALKVIKLGMDTKSVVVRFEAERQALALMDHPNIAKVLDAGATEAGRPYFVMELVRGSKLTDYCDQHNLSTRERLDLFMQVCRAVQHAHQKGIIHRDLKPSNILVTMSDGVAVPKVIDFGIAKATQGKLTDNTVYTAVEQFLGTPAYMSPEQAELSALDIDTRSDIYSLGVLLYELLTGQTPFDARELLKGGLDEMRRQIREQEPSKPSTRLSTLLGADLTGIAKCRSVEPPKLIHLVRGDLDWMVMKCLEKDRARRYDTANGLAMDIQRHLGNEPILARPPGGLYRFRKLVRRHRLAFTAAGAVAGLLVTGLGLATMAVVRIAHDSQIIKKANTDATENLWAAYLSEAEARRTSGRAGQRFDSLATLQKAAAIHASMEVRNSVIASLALSDLRPAKQVEVNGPKQLIRFAANLEKYARVESNGTISIRAAADDSVLATLPPTGWPVSGIWFAPSRQFLLVEYVTANEVSRWVWNWVQAKAVLKELPGQSGNFSPDGNYFAHSNPDGSVAIYDLSTGTEAKHLNPGRGFDLLVFNNQNTLLAGVSNGRLTVDLLATDPGRAISTLTCPAPVNCLAWSPEGRFLAAGGADSKIYVWNVETGTRQFVLDGQARPNKLAISHAGNILASSGGDANTRLWSLDSGRQIVSYPGWSDDLQFSADDRYLGAIMDGGSRYSLLEVAQGQEYRRLYFEDASPTALVTGMEFSADGRMILAAAEDRVQFWEVATGKAIASLQTFGPCLTPVFDPKGTALITSERSGGVYSRALKHTDSASGRGYRLGQPRLIYKAEAAREMSLSRDGRHLAAVANHELGQSVILDLEHPASIVTLGIHPLVDYIAISPEARWAATGSWQNSLVKVWDARTGELVRELHMPKRTRVWFSPDGHWLATSGLTYQLWEAGSWTPKTLEVPTHPIPQFNYLTFSPDGKIIAVLIEGRKIQLLETATGSLLATLEAPDSNAERLCFSPDGRHLAALESDQHVQLWDLRLIRERLARMGLDWSMPPYLPEGSGPPTGPVTLQIGPDPASRVQNGE